MAMDPVDQPRLSRFQPTQREPGLRIPAALREPLRLATVVGSVLLVAGAMSAWVEVWLPGRGWSEQSSFAGPNDGGITLELGLAIFAIAWAERLWSNRLAVLVAGPFVLGLIALLDLRVAFAAATTYLDGDSLHNSGGHGFLLPGFWLAIAGAALATLAGGIRIWRARHTTRWSIGVARSFAGAAAGGIVGTGLGFFIGITVGTRVTTGQIGGVTGSAMILFAIGFAFAGAWLGAATGSFIATRTKRA